MTAVAALAVHLGLDPTGIDQASAEEVCQAADLLVRGKLGDGYDTCPQVILDQAGVIVAAELWRRRDAPGGVVNAWGDTTVPIRLARDPLTPALPILAPWATPGIA
ncbi:hypothetical protein [Acidipropionibacterium timonense]|uniref:hypothetical protein n=1 Tax=Acidipropionibacterium timonense TaxID=2161818 RepID=UPI0010300A41|nr:hypothetical protein [Acidipropionibacterium timonense]